MKALPNKNLITTLEWFPFPENTPCPWSYVFISEKGCDEGSNPEMRMAKWTVDKDDEDWHFEYDADGIKVIPDRMVTHFAYQPKHPNSIR